MPLIRRISDVVTPAHALTVFDSSVDIGDFDLLFVEGVLRSRSPVHERRFVVAPGFELNDPVSSDSLLSWMAMNMLPLRHIDPGHALLIPCKIFTDTVEFDKA